MFILVYLVIFFVNETNKEEGKKDNFSKHKKWNEA